MSRASSADGGSNGHRTWSRLTASIGRQSTSLHARSTRPRASGAVASARNSDAAAAWRLVDGAASARSSAGITAGFADSTASQSASAMSASRPAAGVAAARLLLPSACAAVSRRSALTASSRLALAFLSDGHSSCHSSRPACVAKTLSPCLICVMRRGAQAAGSTAPRRARGTAPAL